MTPAPNPACDFGPRPDRETRSADTRAGHLMTRDAREAWPTDVPVGTFDIDLCTVARYPGATAHIIFVCPNGRRCGVFLGPRHVDRPADDSHCIWAWNGDRDRPTITPSINCLSEKDGMPTGGCGWHGFITTGVIR